MPRVLSTLFTSSFYLPTTPWGTLFSFAQYRNWGLGSITNLFKITQQVMELVSDQGSLSVEFVLLTTTLCCCSVREQGAHQNWIFLIKISWWRIWQISRPSLQIGTTTAAPLPACVFPLEPVDELPWPLPEASPSAGVLVVLLAFPFHCSSRYHLCPPSSVHLSLLADSHQLLFVLD